jgi:hypothetical protein
MPSRLHHFDLAIPQHRPLLTLYDLQRLARLMAKAESAACFGDYIIQVASMTSETHTDEERYGRGTTVEHALSAMLEDMEEVKQAVAKCMVLQLGVHDCENVDKAAAAVAAETEGWGEGQTMWEGSKWPLMTLPSILGW